MDAALCCCLKEVRDCLVNKIKERFLAIISLDDSVRKLRTEMAQLRSQRKDKETDVVIEESKGFRLRRTEVVAEWLKEVDELWDKVRKFDEDFNGPPPPVRVGVSSELTNKAGTRPARDLGGCCCGLCEQIRPCCCRCCCGLCSILKRWGGRLCVVIKLSGEVAALLAEVRDLTGQVGEIKQLVHQVVGEKETYDTVMVGSGATDALLRIRDYLTAANVGIIGIYGMGGVGKTTLLRTIQHEYIHERRSVFQRVIWAEVTRYVDMDQLMADPNREYVVDIARLRNSIGSQLPGSSSSSGWDAESLKEALLNSGRFLLLLENLWKELQLEEIGIPTPDVHNRCKIVFTTRSKGVCNDMGAEGVRLNPLTEDDDFKLFRCRLNNNPLLNSCEGHAKEIVRECHGLPLALEVMASVMRNKNFKRDWMHTLEALRNPRTMFGDGVLVGAEKVFKILVYSYRHLPHEWRPCLLYCSLFDSSVGVDVEELIDYWIGEGFLDGGALPVDMDSARREGRDIINQLVSACLLDCSGDEDETVKMHGLIRDMAIKIGANKFLAYPDYMTKGEKEKGENWEQAQRISLTGSNVSRLSARNCSKLETLLLRNCRGLEEIPEEFFIQMSTLRVLDLCDTRIKGLPRTILNLKKLRYLNLSHTDITSLPEETGEMENLIHLDLSFTLHLESIPYQAISRLDKLRALSLRGSRYRDWKYWNASAAARALTLGDLEGLTALRELRLNIIDDEILSTFLDSSLAESTVCLNLEGFRGLRPAETEFDALEKLRELCIANFLELEELVFKHRWLLNLEILELSSLSIEGVSITELGQNIDMRRLQRLDISGCNNLEDLSWVRHLWCIESLSVSNCSKLKTVVIAGQEEDRLCFYSLKAITFVGLRSFESFSKCRVEMSSAPSITVDDCPSLTGAFVYYDERGIQRIYYQDCQRKVAMNIAQR